MVSLKLSHQLSDIFRNNKIPRKAVVLERTVLTIHLGKVNPSS